MSTLFNMPHDATPEQVTELAERLAIQRKLDNVRREDAKFRRAANARHREEIADVDEWAGLSRSGRASRRRAANRAQKLSDLYHTTANEGRRAAIEAQIKLTGEYRAVTLHRVNRYSMLVLFPMMIAFAAWSTAGVREGMKTLMHFTDGTMTGYTAWGLEPCLIGLVAVIIIARHHIKASGGTTDKKIDCIEYIALGTSVLLNIVGGWPELSGTGLAGFASGLTVALPHAIGAIACAVIASLIGLISGYVTAAKPWKNSKRIDDLGFDTDEIDRIQISVEQDERPQSPVETTETKRVVQEPSAPENPAAIEQNPVVTPRLTDIEPTRSKTMIRTNDDLVTKFVEAFPNWQKETPSVRDVQRAFGMGSTSTASNARRKVMILLTEESN